MPNIEKDSWKVLVQYLMKLTGGASTLQKSKKVGGLPFVCIVFDPSCWATLDGWGITNDSIGRPASSVDSLTHLVDFLRLSVTWTAADMDSSQADVDSSQANVDSSQADVDSSQANVDSSQANVDSAQADVDSLSPSRRGLNSRNFRDFPEFKTGEKHLWQFQIETNWISTIIINVLRQHVHLSASKTIHSTLALVFACNSSTNRQLSKPRDHSNFGNFGTYGGGISSAS